MISAHVWDSEMQHVIQVNTPDGKPLRFEFYITRGKASDAFDAYLENGKKVYDLGSWMDKNNLQDVLAKIAPRETWRKDKKWGWPGMNGGSGLLRRIEIGMTP